MTEVFLSCIDGKCLRTVISKQLCSFLFSCMKYSSPYGVLCALFLVSSLSQAIIDPGWQFACWTAETDSSSLEDWILFLTRSSDQSVPRACHCWRTGPAHPLPFALALENAKEGKRKSPKRHFRIFEASTPLHSAENLIISVSFFRTHHPSRKVKKDVIIDPSFPMSRTLALPLLFLVPSFVLPQGPQAQQGLVSGNLSALAAST